MEKFEMQVEECEQVMAPSFMCAHGIMHVDGGCFCGQGME